MPPEFKAPTRSQLPQTVNVGKVVLRLVDPKHSITQIRTSIVYRISERDESISISMSYGFRDYWKGYARFGKLCVEVSASDPAGCGVLLLREIEATYKKLGVFFE